MELITKKSAIFDFFQIQAFNEKNVVSHSYYDGSIISFTVRGSGR
jgi:hypothetical protein